MSTGIGGGAGPTEGDGQEADGQVEVEESAETEVIVCIVQVGQ